MSVWAATISTVIVAVIAIVILWVLFYWLYRRSTNDRAFVRTGLGGLKVVVDGGAFVVPVLHNVTDVNMNTLRLEIRRQERDSLITRDRMRADVTAQFNLRVQASPAAVAAAARTLGSRTLRPESLQELLEGRFIDALRDAAASRTMEELHENRGEFIRSVRDAVAEDLLKNGLELESASLTALDQTDRQHFNPTNAFDAEGLTRLTEEIENRRRKRNEIEQESTVAIQMKNLEAERRKLDIFREEEYARLEQERAIALRRAEQTSVIASEEAAKRREAEQAAILAELEVNKSRLSAEQEAEERRIRKERELEEARVAREEALEVLRIRQQEAIELANQKRDMAVAEHSRSQSEALAEASRAKAAAVEAEEAVFTLRDVSRAEREHQIELLSARKQAEQAAIAALVAAETERKSTEERVAAARLQTAADADAMRAMAEAEAKAEALRTESAEARYRVEAEAQQAMHAADNSLAAPVIDMKLRLALIERLQDIIRESVKPMESIDGIKIVQVDGLAAAGGSGSGGGGSGELARDGAGSGGGNLADQVVNSALRYRGMAPVVDALLEEVGFANGDLGSLSKSLTDQLGKNADPQH